MIEKGTRIYNHGDMANYSHHGTVIGVVTDRWGTRYQIKPDEPTHAEDDGAPYWIPAALVSPEFLGHSGTRIVTEEAYRDYRQKQIAAMQEAMRKAT